jgi:hypothetical protein
MPTLNDASAVYVGDTAADRVYLGDQLVWEPNVTPTIITNIITNPSAETNMDGWAVFAGGGGVAARSRQIADGVSGPAFMRATWTTGTSGIGSGLYFGSPTFIPVTVGTTYTVSGSVRCSKSQRIVVKLEWSNASSGSISQSAVHTQVIPANAWTRLAGSATAPALAVNARASFFSDPGAGGSVWLVGDTLDVDAAMLTEGATVWDYRDGSFTSDGWAWTGTANASTSFGPGQT